MRPYRIKANMKKNKDKNKTYYKQTGLISIKGADVTPDMLDIINTKYAQETLAADDIYIQKELLAHNGIDRDRERFPEDLLEDYARTLPGKSLLEVHDRSRLPIGLYFDAKTEEISKDKFKEITGEEIRLPDGTKKATVIFAWIYTLRKEWNQKLIDNLAGGIYRHRSIGFTASDFTAIKGEFDQVLYFEYVGPGEAREGSIVYLGAQPGAVMQKGADVQKISDVENYKDAQFYRKKGEEVQNLNSWIKSRNCPDGFCKVDGTLIKGESLAALLNRRINQQEDEDRTRADIVQEMAQAAGIATGTVSQILNGSINCPPINRLEGFAQVLGMAINTLISAAKKDGCEYEDKDINRNNNEKGGKDSMDLKAFLEKLSKDFKTLFTEEGIVEEIKALVGAAGEKADKDVKAKDDEVTGLKSEIETLKPLAADGKAFREELVKENIRMKAALKDIGESEEDQKGVKSVVENHPIDYLKNENESLLKRMVIVFPDEAQTKGDANRDKSKDGKKKNVLIPDTGD